MVPVRVLGVALDSAQQHVVLLAPLPGGGTEGGIVLPVWIGPQEAMSILVAIERAATPRPLAHDLMAVIIRELSASVERVAVTRLVEGTFFADIHLATPRGPFVIDARPSDAIALAARTDAPILVAEAVLTEAGVPEGAMEFDTRGDDDRVEEFRKFLDDVDPDDFQG
ncbi:bifunctional nuclease family protein [Microbacterium sp.]|uniref:bifunctional nuclease family protein n=1 Tax=Microbacterium sp. TaxID=51671 RepID=UPI0025D1C517|nr:bifunctional nuclease family protein [Microbacterium sp.]MBT9607330.1 bifunctional nuclease family protein [Microbacterium sp.]